ncbi:MAG: DUF2147 domain-containing protein [Hyphomicrobium sp.]|uniref:DUF2147 domain-containing protein n=1 Tax=Hyphomicrobium sp. TaxID=82 RepID=UPI001320B9FE|nr:DUF2147 domain-containing protein [Hyphomicrobium sp.]KAB2939855.1 MAG: DUF2147 domain-containing protein [Hyphomicrobium sp.]MBZ0208665.1 DUF2147 domain-containing protein [Hyphomicrobium sp.]
MRHDLLPPTGLKNWASATVCGLLLGFVGGAAEAAPAVEAGIWINHTGKGAVEIRPCGDSGASANRLCGFIVWLKEPNNRRGEPLTDGYNPEPSKRKRPICGLPVLGSLQRVSGGWDNGWVYDPEQGAAFDAAIELASRDRLILTGYKGVKLFSKSFTWRRAPADLPRCDQPREVRATSGEARAVVAKKATQANSLPQLKAPRPVPAVRPQVVQ